MKTISIILAFIMVGCCQEFPWEKADKKVEHFGVVQKMKNNSRAYVRLIKEDTVVLAIELSEINVKVGDSVIVSACYCEEETGLQLQKMYISDFWINIKDVKIEEDKQDTVSKKDTSYWSW